mgnify:CR=1 FL=1
MPGPPSGPGDRTGKSIENLNDKTRFEEGVTAFKLARVTKSVVVLSPLPLIYQR